ncbi:MAG TPA: hypothetical protein VGK16_06630 [Candidatus Limnocylindrales bacterium]
MDPQLRLYPGRWQRRYAHELDALLGDEPPGLRARLDLVAGAVDAHLHPWWVPAWPVVAAAAGGLGWTFGGAVALGQPVPPDWPGYLQETLPIFLAAAPLLLLATLGASTRLGSRDPATARVGRPVASIGWLAWILLLVAAAANLGAGAPLALAATAAAAGILLVGIALLGAGDWGTGAALLVAALVLVVPAPWSATAFGVAWTVAAIAQVRDPRPRPRTTGRLA